MNGFFLIDKESGQTSFKVVAAVRRIIGEKSVGHAGTLDPLATGLLLIAAGEATKLLEFLVGEDKEYLVKGKFGYVSDTYDADGKIEPVDVGAVFQQADLEKLIEQNFLGEIEQVPPKYSAIWVDGKRAHDLARNDKEFELKARKVRIDQFEVVDFQWPEVSFKVKCSTGTYVRSLIHDLGMKLGCGGYVAELRRSKIGDFVVENAVKLDELSKNFEQKMISMEEIAKKFETYYLDEESWTQLQYGRTLLTNKFEHDEPVMAFYKDKLVGVLKNSSKGGIKFRKIIL